MRSLAAVLVASLGLLAFAAPAGAVTLVNPDGTPVGGQWQKWVAEMRVPTISGPLAFSTDATICGGAMLGRWRAFTSGRRLHRHCGRSGQSLSRDTLYFELGHQFDWHYLTPGGRSYLAHQWHTAGHSWWDSSPYGENGLEAIFASEYAGCAEGMNDNNSSFSLFEPPGFVGWVPHGSTSSHFSTCRYIDRIARRAGADMDSTRLAWWNRTHA